MLGKIFLFLGPTKRKPSKEQGSRTSRRPKGTPATAWEVRLGTARDRVGAEAGEGLAPGLKTLAGRVLPTREPLNRRGAARRLPKGPPWPPTWASTLAGVPGKAGKGPPLWRARAMSMARKKDLRGRAPVLGTSRREGGGEPRSSSLGRADHRQRKPVTHQQKR